MRILTAERWPVRRGMLLAGCVAVICGMLAMNLPPWSLFALAAAFLFLLLIPLCRRPAVVFAAVTTAVLLCFGASYRLLVEKPCGRLDGQRDTVTAVVQEVSDSRMLIVTIQTAQHAARGTRVLLYCGDQAMPSRYETVHGEVEFRRLYDTQKRYRADGVFLQAYPVGQEEEALTVLPRARSFRTVMEGVRTHLLEELRSRMPREEGALMAGLCLGELGDVSSGTETAFRRAGLPHLLVVSGLHLSVVGGACYAVLRALLRHRRLAALGTMAAVLLFALLVGFSPSVSRAVVACVGVLSGHLFSRRPDGLNSLGLALTILVAASPYCLLDIGLLLSFGATAGILCLYAPLCRCLRRLPLWLASSLAATLSATVAITSILAWQFGEVSLVSPLANVLTVAATGVSLMLGCAALVVAVIPPLAAVADGLLFLAVWPMRWTSMVATVLGGLPFATVPIERVWTFVYLTGACCLGILCIYRRDRRLLRRTAALLMSLLLVVGGVSQWTAYRQLTVTVSVSRERPLFLVECGDTRGLIALQAADLIVDSRLQRSCANGLDFLIIGEGDSADAARVTALLHQTAVDRVLVGGNPDWLFGVELTPDILQSETALPLGDDVTLTVSTVDGWRLEGMGTTLAIAPGPAARPADAAVFIGNLPPADGWCAAQQVLLVGAPTPENIGLYTVTAVTDGYGYLTARRGGDWSITRWR